MIDDAVRRRDSERAREQRRKWRSIAAGREEDEEEDVRCTLAQGKTYASRLVNERTPPLHVLLLPRELFISFLRSSSRWGGTKWKLSSKCLRGRFVSKYVVIVEKAEGPKGEEHPREKRRAETKRFSFFVHRKFIFRQCERARQKNGNR